MLVGGSGVSICSIEERREEGGVLLLLVGFLYSATVYRRRTGCHRDHRQMRDHAVRRGSYNLRPSVQQGLGVKVWTCQEVPKGGREASTREVTAGRGYWVSNRQFMRQTSVVGLQ